MLKQFASLLLLAALVCTLCATPAFTQTASQPEVKWNRVSDSSDSAGKKAAQPHAGLKADIQKLVAAVVVILVIVVVHSKNHFFDDAQIFR